MYLYLYVHVHIHKIPICLDDLHVRSHHKLCPHSKQKVFISPSRAFFFAPREFLKVVVIYTVAQIKFRTDGISLMPKIKTPDGWLSLPISRLPLHRLDWGRCTIARIREPLKSLRHETASHHTGFPPGRIVFLSSWSSARNFPFINQMHY